jgi:hypothetical protein
MWEFLLRFVNMWDLLQIMKKRSCCTDPFTLFTAKIHAQRVSEKKQYNWFFPCLSLCLSPSRELAQPNFIPYTPGRRPTSAVRPLPSDLRRPL